MSNKSSKTEKRGVLGTAIYPVRIIGYLLASMSIISTQLYVTGNISALAIIFIGLMLVYPHVAFLIYHKKKNMREVEFITLLIDMFWIAWISNFVYFMPAVFLPYLITNSATNYAVNGLPTCLKGIAIYIGTTLIAFFINQTTYQTLHLPDIYLLPSFIYLFAGSHYIGLLSHWRGAVLRKAKREIEQKNLVLQSQTDKLLVLNEEYNQQNQEILAQKDNIEQQKILLEKHNHIIEEINTNITESIHYAKLIQETILPLPEHLESFFKEYFILFKPRDIVSGDFYFFEKIEKYGIIGAVDCTGHGIPGAFMSLIANQILQEIINKGIYSPENILYHLNNGIKQALKQKETSNRDGMDIGICLVDKQKREVHFAGAKSSLIYFENDVLHIIKSNNFSIGGEQRESHKFFEKQTIYLKPDVNYSFYMFSDGFHDQFGGNQGKKFGKKRFRELLTQVKNQPFIAQKITLENTLLDWIGNYNEMQIDDILVLGFKI